MRNFALLAATVAAGASLSLAGATSAEAHKHRHHRGVSIVIGAPMVYGGYHYGHSRYGYYPSPYYRGYEPDCLRWQKYYSRSGKLKWRCVAW